MKRNIITVPIRRVSDASVTPEQDLLAVEEPLQIRIGKRNVAITMRTPGNDAELAAGFLLSEGILQRAPLPRAIHHARPFHCRGAGRGEWQGRAQQASST